MFVINSYLFTVDPLVIQFLFAIQTGGGLYTGLIILENVFGITVNEPDL